MPDKPTFRCDAHGEFDNPTFSGGDHYPIDTWATCPQCQAHCKRVDRKRRTEVRLPPNRRS